MSGETEQNAASVNPQKLPERDREFLVRVYRGKISSIPCESLGDEYRWSREEGRAIHVGKVSAEGQSWLNLEKAKLIDDYDSFGGFHYCHITKAGEQAAEQIIALRARATLPSPVKEAE